MDETNVRAHKSRRLTREEEIEIWKIIQFYYNYVLTKEGTHHITCCDDTTISKHCNKCSVEIAKSDALNQIEREENERVRVILCYRGLMCEANQVLDYIKTDIERYRKEDKPVPSYLIGRNIEIIGTISTLNENRGSFVIQPTLKDVFDMIIEKWLKKNEKWLKKNEESNPEK